VRLQKAYDDQAIIEQEIVMLRAFLHEGPDIKPVEAGPKTIKLNVRRVEAESRTIEVNVTRK
jgi:hypothetical protein